MGACYVCATTKLSGKFGSRKSVVLTARPKSAVSVVSCFIHLFFRTIITMRKNDDDDDDGVPPLVKNWFSTWWKKWEGGGGGIACIKSA